jgi:hypothetical protein
VLGSEASGALKEHELSNWVTPHVLCELPSLPPYSLQVESKHRRIARDVGLGTELAILR